ncbi:MAG: F0F1 ATP synthase subunit epsilon [Bacillus thermozeamaize]|jgi:F-type H+-transporting ATPase subunit epsilon|uniref:ATP synthase epsilon chain n=1 Tax=Bacillus thermozeamaize TaxID=230954 RepID=A0A1Y3PFU8_9BACI|nr:MAG: F0F1 ATP synthase subunit epsilon [Bacillus thermozeamaize]
MSTVQFDLVTPERTVISRPVEMVVAKTTVGEIGILPGHAPLVANLAIDILRIKEAEETHELAVHGGFLEVTPERVVVLAEAAEFPEEIDVDRALAAKERAERRLAEKGSEEIDFKRAELALQRAMNRLKLARK